MILVRNISEYNNIVMTGADGKSFNVSKRHMNAIEYAVSAVTASPINASSIILHGSCARSKADYDSDVDISNNCQRAFRRNR